MDAAAILATQATAHAAAKRMDRQLDQRMTPVAETLKRIEEQLGEVTRRLVEAEEGPTISLEELERLALEEMDKVPTATKPVEQPRQSQTANQPAGEKQPTAT